MICEVKNRPGLSAIALASAVIKRLSEAGIETGVNADGTPNKVNKFVRIFSEEIVKEFKDNAQITCALESGVVSSLGTGANSGGPVVVKSVNTFPINIYGLYNSMKKTEEKVNWNMASNSRLQEECDNLTKKYEKERAKMIKAHEVMVKLSQEYVEVKGILDKRQGKNNG